MEQRSAGSVFQAAEITTDTVDSGAYGRFLRKTSSKKGKGSVI